MCRFHRNDYEPDVCFFNKEKSDQFTDDQTIFPIPDFVIEILSESTKDRDRGIKKLDYALNGVSEYWIIDPDTESVEQYLPGEENEYGEAVIHYNGTLSCQVLKGLDIEVKSLFI